RLGSNRRTPAFWKMKSFPPCFSVSHELQKRDVEAKLKPQGTGCSVSPMLLTRPSLSSTHGEVSFKREGRPLGHRLCLTRRHPSGLSRSQFIASSAICRGGSRKDAIFRK